MSGPGLVASFGLASAAGVCLVAAALGRAAGAVEWVGRLALGALAGVGATSLLAFAWLFAAGGIGDAYPYADGAVCLLVAAALLRLPRTRDALVPPALDAREAALLAALLVAAALATWRFVAATEVMPHGEWDAWEIWNQRARHILRAGSGWRTAFAAGIKGTEYPLLVPLSVVRAWSYAGEGTAGPAALAGLFTVGGSLVVAGLVSRASGAAAGVAAGLLLFATGNLQLWGAYQYADVPLACYVAAAAGLLLVPASDAPPDRASTRAALGGLALGLAGWTKTEGLLAALVIAVAAVASAGAAGRSSAIAAARGMALGALAPALAWLVQHVVLAPELAPFLTSGQTGLAAKLVDPVRWRTVLGWLSDHAPGRDVWLLFAAIAIAVALGLRPRAVLRSPALWCAAALYAAAALVFVTTPLDLPFHLLTAGDRLMLQPWPLFLLGLFAAAGGPRRAAPAQGAAAPAASVRPSSPRARRSR